MWKSFAWGLGLIVLAVCHAAADEILVAGFTSDSLGRFDATTGAFGGNFESGGMDGTLAARVGPDGLLYVASETSNQVKRYQVSTGDFVDNFISVGAGGLNGPSGLAWDADGHLLVASFNGDSVLRYDGASGVFLGAAVAAGTMGLNGPDNGMTIGPDGQLYVPSYFSNQILRFDLEAGTSDVFVSNIFRPRVIVFKDDQVYITSEVADAVRRYDSNGVFVDNFIQPGSAILDEPVGLEYLNGTWYVSSASMDKVLTFDENGSLLDANFIAAGTGGLDAPVFITAISSIPEPASASAAGLTLVAAFMRRRRGPRRA